VGSFVIRITLICAAGMSTSLLMMKMLEAAKNKGIEVNIEALPESEIEKRIDETDILLLGPQVRYLLSSMKLEYGHKVKVIDVINISDYGLMNGEKILNNAIKNYNQ
jgi:cellobiose PTS system EIIB component